MYWNIHLEVIGFGVENHLEDTELELVVYEDDAIPLLQQPARDEETEAQTGGRMSKQKISCQLQVIGNTNKLGNGGQKRAQL